MQPLHTEQLWLHVSLMYLNPVRPTFTKMTRAQEDSRGRICLEVLRNMEGQVQWATSHEVVASLDTGISWE
eukprot:1167206-Lingulodinium_polyedra.AAC.1